MRPIHKSKIKEVATMVGIGTFCVLVAFFAMMLVLKYINGVKIIINDLDHDVSINTLSTDPFHDNSSRDPANIAKPQTLKVNKKMTFDGGVECVSVNGKAYYILEKIDPQTRRSQFFSTFKLSEIDREIPCPYTVQWEPESHWVCSGFKEKECKRDTSQN